MASSARAVTMAKERDAFTANYVELRSSMDLRVSFANNEMHGQKADIFKMTQEWDANLTKAEHLSLEAQCVLGLADGAKKLLERVLSLKTAARTKVSKGRKLLGMRSNREKTYAGAQTWQARVEADTRNASVAELEALATELEKQL